MARTLAQRRRHLRNTTTTTTTTTINTTAKTILVQHQVLPLPPPPPPPPPSTVDTDVVVNHKDDDTDDSDEDATDDEIVSNNHYEDDDDDADDDDDDDFDGLDNDDAGGVFEDEDFENEDKEVATAAAVDDDDITITTTPSFIVNDINHPPDNNDYDYLPIVTMVQKKKRMRLESHDYIWHTTDGVVLAEDNEDDNVGDNHRDVDMPDESIFSDAEEDFVVEDDDDDDDDENKGKKGAAPDDDDDENIPSTTTTTTTPSMVKNGNPYDDNNDKDPSPIVTPVQKKKEMKLGSRDDRWYTMFMELTQYKKEHDGDTNVPYKFPTNQKLATWVIIQRVLWKEKRLHPNRVEYLKGIGFQFQPPRQNKSHNELWYIMFHELQKYRLKYGTTIVPSRYTTTIKNNTKKISLYQWIQYQRRLYTNGTLRDDRYQQLKTIGFRFDTLQPPLKQTIRNNKELWKEQYQQLLKFQQVYNHTAVPYKWSQNRSLGRWVSTQRKKYHSGKLSNDRIQQLININFIWDATFKKYTTTTTTKTTTTTT